MRMSCNGCRVLRKGCSEDCVIRPCLEWINSHESQANATLFLAKFYGRAGLLNLINAGPHHLRPSIFKSLLHEACGRIINPISGSVGLYSTGKWDKCEAAVEAVLSGSPITPLEMDSEADHVSPLFKSCDIRHVLNKQGNAEDKPSRELHKVKNRTRFKRTANKPVKKPKCEPGEKAGEASGGGGESVSGSGASDVVSGEMVEDTLVKPDDGGVVGEELALGLSLFPACNKVVHKEKVVRVKEEVDQSDKASWLSDVSLGLSMGS